MVGRQRSAKTRTKMSDSVPRQGARGGCGRKYTPKALPVGGAYVVGRLFCVVVVRCSFLLNRYTILFPLSTLDRVCGQCLFTQLLFTLRQDSVGSMA